MLLYTVTKWIRNEMVIICTLTSTVLLEFIGVIKLSKVVIVLLYSLPALYNTFMCTKVKAPVVHTAHKCLQTNEKKLSDR